MRNRIEGLTPERKRTVTNQDIFSAEYQEAKLFRNSTERMSLVDRREAIIYLATEMPRTLESETDKVQKFRHLIKKLILSDPLSDQQAGILARLNPCSLELSLNEVLEFQVGDWDRINQILTSNDQRKRSFYEEVEESETGDMERTVFRGMKLSPKESCKKIFWMRLGSKYNCFIS